MNSELKSAGATWRSGGSPGNRANLRAIPMGLWGPLYPSPSNSPNQFFQNPHFLLYSRTGWCLW
jgi:hypothetical protein